MTDKPAESQRITTDVSTATLTQNVGEPARREYIVTSKHGLFKNGRQFAKGESIELDSDTANNFIANGDVKDPLEDESDEA